MRQVVVTSPHHSDPSLRGRRYAIPFQQVWTAALRVASSTRRWELVEANDLHGRLRIEARPLLLGGISDVEVLIRLDGDAQTRVDLLSRQREPGRLSLGAHARRIRRYLRELDRTVGAAEDSILSPHEGAETLPELTSL
jgi:hypothetical protein